MSRTAPTAAVARAPEAPRKSQNDLIHSQVFTAILEQRLAPGTKLAEDTLGQIFGVSRTVIRAVLQRLAHERIVRIHPNRGAFVAEPSPEEAHEVLEARRLIEEGIMRLAIQKCSPSDIAMLQDMVAAEQKSLDAGDHQVWVRQSGDFHLRLARIAGSETLTAYLRELISRTSLIIVQYQKGNLSSCACDEHLDIIDALSEKDEARAVTVMLDHLSTLENNLHLSGESPKSDLYAIFQQQSENQEPAS
ncbi:MAG: GntR family transcriptional regulator [Alphaproteobacteria bacterium]|nr:MAG: GntR family transcriptional regulator [Alphaproteobacteria bacterium]